MASLRWFDVFVFVRATAFALYSFVHGVFVCKSLKNPKYAMFTAPAPAPYKMIWLPLLCYVLTISESIFHHSDDGDDDDDDEDDEDADENEDNDVDDTENVLKYLWSSQNIYALVDEFDLCKR